jgi:hypothetical protein
MKRILITFLLIMLVQLVFSQEKISDFSLEYEAVSRSVYQKIEVNKDTFVFIEDRAGKKNSQGKISNKQWKKIVALVNKIKLKQLSSLKAPSENRKFDGAAHAKLKVLYKDDIFESSSFDHGNPPVEIKTLVEYIINISKSVNKT